MKRYKDGMVRTPKRDLIKKMCRLLGWSWKNEGWLICTRALSIMEVLKIIEKLEKK